MKPASGEAQTKLKVGYHWSMNNLTKGQGTVSDWQTVADALNVAMVLCEMNYGADYLPDLEKGMQAMLSLRNRYRQTNRFIFRAEEMQAVNLGLELHDEQIAIVPLVHMEKALDEVEKRLTPGFSFSPPLSRRTPYPGSTLCCRLARRRTRASATSRPPRSAPQSRFAS